MLLLKSTFSTSHPTTRRLVERLAVMFFCLHHEPYEPHPRLPRNSIFLPMQRPAFAWRVQRQRPCTFLEVGAGPLLTPSHFHAISSSLASTASFWLAVRPVHALVKRLSAVRDAT